MHSLLTQTTIYNYIRDDPFSAYAKLSVRVTFLTP